MILMKAVILSSYKECLADLRHLLSLITFISSIYDYRGSGLKVFYFVASLLENWSLHGGGQIYMGLCNYRTSS